MTPDIAMCRVPDCPKSAECRRHPDSGTKPSGPMGEWQVWAEFLRKAGEPCAMYWPVMR